MSDVREAGGKVHAMNERTVGTADLIRRCLDGVATEMETAELSRLVGRDASVARQLAEAAQLESRLEIVMRGGAETSPASQPVALPRRRARTALWAAATITAAAAAGLALAWSMGTKPVAREGDSVAAKLEARVDPATHIRFADGSTADLRNDSSRLETRSSNARGIDLVLSRGGARFEVVPRHGRRFRIWVGSAYVEVIGTIFTVDRLPTGVRVSVERGVVKVVSGQNETRLSEGTAEVVPIEATPPPLAPDVPTPAPAAERVEPKPPRHAAVSDEPGALLRASEVARRNGHPQDAVTSLQRLLAAHPRDPRAPYAAFILGRVLLEELHRPREAAAAFAQVEALDASTPLVQDALAREVESWARAKDVDQARRAAATYLGRYPTGRRADEVRRYSRME